MPITQDRLITLIETIDQIMTAFDRLRGAISAEHEAALTLFYAADGNNNPLASNILAHVQAINMLASEPLLSFQAIANLAAERTHFQALRNHNQRSAQAMRRARIRKRNLSTHYTSEASE